MNSFSIATIYGTVSAPAEEKYFGVQNPRKFYELTVTVEGAKDKRMMFPIGVFDEGLMVQVQQLKLNQRVLVTCTLTNNPWQGKDGRVRANLSLTARSIVPGQAHANTPAKPAAAAPAHGRGMMGQRSEQVQQNTMEDDDIPF